MRCPLAARMPPRDGQLRCRQAHARELVCAYLAVKQRSARSPRSRPAQPLLGLLLAVLGQLFKLPTLGLAAVPVGVGVLLPGPAVTAPALPSVRRLCQRHRPPPSRSAWFGGAVVMAGCLVWWLADRPPARALRERYFTHRCWSCTRWAGGLTDFVQTCWVQPAAWGLTRTGSSWRRSRCSPTSSASVSTGSWSPSPTRSPATRPLPRSGPPASWPPSTSTSSSAPGCWRPPPPTRPAAAPAPAAPQGLPAGRDRGGHQHPSAPLRPAWRPARPGDRRRPPRPLLLVGQDHALVLLAAGRLGLDTRGHTATP